MVMIHKTTSILLVGFGNMGSALFRGWLNMGFSNLSILDPNQPDEDSLKSCLNFYKNTEDIRTSFDVVVLAVKPQIIESVCNTLSPILDKNTLIISIAAGKTLDTLAQYFPETNPSIVRIMPNLPASIAKGVSVCCANKHCSAHEKNITDGLMNGVGNTKWIEDENDMHAVTALSGSGPAYLFLLVEAMAEAGIKNGLAPDLSMGLARQTVIGSAELMKENTLPVDKLRENVTSKGGTTEAALDILMGDNDFSNLMFKAIQSAKKRSQSL